MINKSNYHSLAAFLMIFLSGILAIAAYSLSEYTLIAFHVPVAFSVSSGLLSGAVMWKSRFWIWLTKTSAFLPNYLCHSVCTGIFLMAVFYVCNFAFADSASSHTEMAVVEQTYYKIRHKTRRVSRNHYARGEAFNQYYMKVRLSNGAVKEQMIKQQKYIRLHKGDTVPLQVSKGFFGVSVIKGGAKETTGR